MLLLELYRKAELRPFIPVVAEFKSRLTGIEAECEPLGLSFEKEMQSEQEIFFALISQKALAFDVTNEMGEVWDIRLEPFSYFKSRSKKITFPFMGCNEQKQQNIREWIIALYNWEGSFLYSSEKH
ncbi:hypothetical protein [Pseudoalteromonas sp. meg-B1]|uniref:hypothetical protein n=1 Tax=Pseudoalteromonas sp. meg-B1 TaxID=2203192 RepID=UPI000D70390C|nr:hypothetical protein [Pseudoalteromonas sp. meg-B1]PWS55265.1 hypothetical protein DK924_00400 [Pseudoalteromonas sp. meg-B1]